MITKGELLYILLRIFNMHFFLLIFYNLISKDGKIELYQFNTCDRSVTYCMTFVLLLFIIAEATLE